MPLNVHKNESAPCQSFLDDSVKELSSLPLPFDHFTPDDLAQIEGVCWHKSCYPGVAGFSLVA